jgi:hypothetical protein
MECKKIRRLLTLRDGIFRIEDEEDKRLQISPDKLAYWQDSDMPSDSDEILNLLIGKLPMSIQRKAFSFVTQEEFQKLDKDVEELKTTVKRIDVKMEELLDISPKIVVLEEISAEEARKRVEDYFKKHEQADIEELMLNLKIPVQTIVAIIDEMKKEGKLVPKGERNT